MADQNDQSVDLGALERAVADLTKAAGTTSLSKGGIENSGTYTDGKPSGGGQATETGTIDDMMIGKMVAAGFDAGTIASFKAFLSAKAGEGVDDEDEDDEEMSGAASAAPPVPGIAKKSGKAPAGAPLAKSAMEQLREDPVLADQFDASDYLEHITVRVAEQLDGIRKSVAADAAGQRNFNVALSKAVVEQSKLIKSQQRVIKALGERLGLVERAPVAAPKGATSAPRARAMTKSMPGEAGAPDGGPLRKSEVLSTLTYMNLEKGIRHINGQKTSEIVTLFEGGGVLDERTVEFVKGWLSANPTEAELAKSYS
jgi:uncharacterized coiled-coil protein SlyX